MNQSEKLDEILNGFAYLKMKLDEGTEALEGNNVKGMCEKMEISIDEGEDRILESILLDDGYLERINPKISFIFRISDKGVNFLFSGGYQQLDIDNEKRQEEGDLNIKLIKSSIRTNQWTKIGIALSVIISLIALVLSILTLIKKP